MIQIPPLRLRSQRSSSIGVIKYKQPQSSTLSKQSAPPLVFSLIASVTKLSPVFPSSPQPKQCQRHQNHDPSSGQIRTWPHEIIISYITSFISKLDHYLLYRLFTCWYRVCLCMGLKDNFDWSYCYYNALLRPFVRLKIAIIIIIRQHQSIPLL